MSDISAFAEAQLALIELERDAEASESSVAYNRVGWRDLVDAGVALTGLIVESIHVGLAGRTLVSLAAPLTRRIISHHKEKEKEKDKDKDKIDAEKSGGGSGDGDGDRHGNSKSSRHSLPSHKISNGDIVAVGARESFSLSDKDGGSKKSNKGVVYKVNDHSITVAFDDDEDEGHQGHEGELRLGDETALLKLGNDVTYKRLRIGMERLRDGKMSGVGAGRLRSVLFGHDEPSRSTTPLLSTIKFFNEGMNESQKRAVEFALQSKDIALVHGPPGTGKTTTVVEIIRQLVQLGCKVLAVAGSNIAVDNLCERLVVTPSKAKKINLVRLGHPARVLPSVVDVTLESILNRSEDTAIVNDVRKEIEDIIQQTRNPKRAHSDRSQRPKMLHDLKALRKELRKRENQAVANIMGNASVILATTTMVLGYELDDLVFDVVVIDEAAQVLEASCWGALLKAGRAILAGDHLQLPPTVKSDAAAKGGLSVTLFDRLVKLYGDKVRVLLDVQYRMNQKIMEWSSRALYDGRMKADPAVANHLLTDLPGRTIAVNDETTNALVLIDTAGCDMPEWFTDFDVSKANEGEARIAAAHIQMLLQSGLRGEDIGVISPYNAQVQILRELIHPLSARIEIDSVDGFQGREKEAIIISLVRSNDKAIVGFLSEDRRMNVAVTRGRRHVAVICDSATVSHHKFLAEFIEYCSKDENADVRTAHQYQHVLAGIPSVERPQMKVKSVPISSSSSSSSLSSSSLSSSSSSSTASKSTSTATKNAKPINKQQQQQQQLSQQDQSSSSQPPREGNNESRELRNAREREELEEILSAFLKRKDETTHNFPATLTSYQRMIVHELADAMGLIHESVGEGVDRRVTVTKKSKHIPIGKKKESNVLIDSHMGMDLINEGDDDDDDRDSRQIPGNNDKKGKNEDGDKNKDNNNDDGEEEEGDDDDDGNEDAVTTTATTTPNTASSSAGKNNKGKKKKQKKKSSSTAATTTTTTSATDSEELIRKTLESIEKVDLDAIQDSMSRCAYTGSGGNSLSGSVSSSCKTSVALIGSNCNYCKRRFCLAHIQPEAHSSACTAAAKQQGRASMRESLSSSSFSSSSSSSSSAMKKPLQEHQKQYLKEKLKEKIDREKQARTSTAAKDAKKDGGNKK